MSSNNVAEIHATSALSSGIVPLSEKVGGKERNFVKIIKSV